MSGVIGYITIPVYQLPEGHFTGFRQGMLDIGPHSVSTGGGLGTDDIWTEIKEGDETVYRRVYGRDVIAAVAKLVNHPDADRFPSTEGFSVERVDGNHDP